MTGRRVLWPSQDFHSPPSIRSPCPNLLWANLVNTCVMRPYRETPFTTANEVGMIICHPQVVNRLPLASVEQILDPHPLAVVAEEHITNLEPAPRNEVALAHHEERVLRRRADHL